MLLGRTMVCCALACVLAVGCAPSEGSVSVVFEWADGAPSDVSDLYLYAKVAESDGVSVLASAGPSALTDTRALNLDAIPNGKGRVLTVEIRDNPGIGSRPLYYGISEPFEMAVDRTTKASVRVHVTAVPDITEETLAGPAVSVSGVAGDGIVGSTDVELVFRSGSAIRAEVSNLAGFETGTFEDVVFEGDAASTDDAGVTTFSAPWDLEAGVTPCGTVDFCPRRVFVRFADAEGYYSETASVDVIADTKAPTVEQSTANIELEPGGDNLLVRQQLGHHIEQMGIGTRVRVSFTLTEVVDQDPVVRAVGLCELLGTCIERRFDLSRLAGNGAFFVYEVALDPDTPAPNDTYVIQVEATDKAGNTAESTLQPPDGDTDVVVDTSAPNAPIPPSENQRPLVYHRVPSGPDPDGAPLGWFGLEGAAGAVEEQSTVLVFDGPDPDTAQRIGVATADDDGGFEVVPLNRLDRAEVYALVVDAAGNHQATASLVRDVEWVASFIGREAGSSVGNPHVFESRPWMLEHVLAQHDGAEAGEAHGIAEDASDDDPKGDGWVPVTAGGAWRSGEPIDGPPPRFWARASYNPLRGETWILGGRVDSYGNCDSDGYDICKALWIWGEGQWRRAQPGDAYADGVLNGRERHAQAYDFDRGELVVFGGKGAVGCTVEDSAFCGDTWVFGGHSWRDATPETGELPMRRVLHTMTYDSKRRQVLMYGGASESVNECNPGRQYCGNTWAWDGVSWSVLRAYDDGARPPDRRGHVMAYDPVLDKTILFGGQSPNADDGSSEYYADTWQWTGTQWQQVGLGVSDPQPSGRYDASLVYSPHHQRLMLFGGNAGDGNSCDGGDRFCGTLWSWDGTQWQPHDQTGPNLTLPAPVGRTAASLSVDQFGHLLLVGGRRTALDEAGDCTQGETALCSGVWWYRDTWVDLTQSEAPSGPPGRSEHVMASLPESGATVLFGGTDEKQQGCGAETNGHCGDTWVWRGSGWEAQAVTSPPTGRSGAAMYHDPVTQQVVMTGGTTSGVPGNCDGSGFKNCRASWGWDGATWSQSEPNFDPDDPAVPDPRSLHVVAYDPDGEALLVAAGSDGDPLSDSWVLSATGWTAGALPGSATRYGGVMGWHEAEDHALLFGGYMDIDPEDACPPEALEREDTCYFGDSWIWDGVTWSPGPADGPFFRKEAALVYVPDRVALLLFGGESPADCGEGSLTCGDLWEWSAGQWRPLAMGDVFGQGRPSPRSSHGFTYDSWRREALLFGGEPQLGDTWSWHPGVGERPGQVARFAFSDTQAPDDVTLRELSLTWEARGAGHDGADMAPGVSLLLWHQGQWRSAHALSGSGLTDDTWQTDDAELLGRLLTGSERIIGLAVAPAATEQAPEPAWVATDHVRLRVSYRLP